MDAAKVVIGKMNRNRQSQVVQLLRECIGQARKSSHRHAHVQVLALDKTGRNVAGARVPDADLGYKLRDSWWGVPPFRIIELTVIPEQFNELREVNIQTKHFLDHFGVEMESIGGELHLIGESLVQVGDEGPRVLDG